MNNREIERVAETNNFLKPVLEGALKKQVLQGPTAAQFPGCATYLDVWQAHLSDRFFNIGSLIRAAASVETGLRDYYCLKKGYSNLSLLRQDPLYKRNIFQRIQPWNNVNDSAIGLLKTIGVDLNTFAQFPRVQELVLHRHLYAHNLGVIDDDYIQNLKRLTGTDLLADPGIVSAQSTQSYPAQDKVWLEPLGRIGAFIQAVRGLFAALPP